MTMRIRMDLRRREFIGLTAELIRLHSEIFHDEEWVRRESVVDIACRLRDITIRIFPGMKEEA